MNKAPAFQFYVQDFLVGTLHFSAEEVGAYLLLLCHQWDNGSVNEQDVEAIARVSKEKLVKVLGKFKRTKKGLVNPRMDATKKLSENFKKNRSNSGKKGAENRWRKPLEIKDIDSTAIDLPLTKNSSSPSSSSSNSKHSLLSSKNVFEIMRRVTNRNTIDDRQVYEETAYFITKYEGQKIKNLEALVNGWAANIKPATKDRFTY